MNLQGLPGALFVMDSFNEEIAVAEPNRLKIPVIALVDSNSDPSVLSHPIPGNDDSTKSIRIIVDVVLDAIQSGSSKRCKHPPSVKILLLLPRNQTFSKMRMSQKLPYQKVTKRMDFDDRKKSDHATDESKDAEPVARCFCSGGSKLFQGQENTPDSSEDESVG